MSELARTFGVPVVAGGTGATVVPSQPPMTKTRPSERSAAACDWRAVESVAGASENAFDMGSKSSRLASAAPFAAPPAKSNWPF